MEAATYMPTQEVQMDKEVTTMEDQYSLKME